MTNLKAGRQAHDAPREEFQALCFLAKPKTLHQNFPVGWTRENIHHPYRRIGEVVQVFLIMDLVVAGHITKLAQERHGSQDLSRRCGIRGIGGSLMNPSPACR